MQLPTLDESIALLQEVSGVDDIDPDTPLQSTDVDSLNLVEWIYEVQERNPGYTIDESIVDGVDEDVTFRAVHALLLQARPAAPAASP